MLSDTWLRRNNGKETDKELVKSDTDCLAARLRNGKISFIYRPRLNGKQIKMTLGRYPSMLLKDARSVRDKYNSLIAQGIDPRQSRKSEITANLSEKTLNEVFFYWYEHYCVEKKVSPELYKRTYELHLQPEFGERQLKLISKREFVSHFIEMARSKPAITERAIVNIKQAIEYAISHAFFGHQNVLADFSPSKIGIEKQAKIRALNHLELLLFYKALLNSTMNEKNKIAQELILIYGARSSEIRLTQKSWLDFNAKTWSVPPEHHKTGKKTKLPLVRPIFNEQVEKLWQRAIELSGSDEHVFTAIKHKKYVTDKPMTRGAFQDLPRVLLRWNEQNNDNQEWAEWTNHDLRRTARTHWTDFGEWATCEKMLGHKLPGESDVYDRSNYLDRMTLVYNKWFTYLKSCENGGTNIVMMDKAVG